MRLCSGRYRTCRASDLRRPTDRVGLVKAVPESLAERNRLRASAQFLNRSVSEFPAAHFLGIAPLESGLRDPLGFDARHEVQTAPPPPQPSGKRPLGTGIAGRVLSAKVAEPHAWREGEWPPSSLPGHSHRRFLRVGDRFSDGAAQMSSRGGDVAASMAAHFPQCGGVLDEWASPTPSRVARNPDFLVVFQRVVPVWPRDAVLRVPPLAAARRRAFVTGNEACLNRPTQKKLSTDIKTDKLMY
jgi:hypothetical protein